ncbi:E3 ubiquitin-protein ligase neurl1b [Mactra antiquata]
MTMNIFKSCLYIGFVVFVGNLVIGEEWELGELGEIKFNQRHGPKIDLLENDTVARRYEGGCWSVCFSDRPLKVNQTLHFNITEVEMGWLANLNVGIYYGDPNDLPLGALVLCDANVSASLNNTEVFIFEAEKFYSEDNVYEFRIDHDGNALLSPNVTSDDIVFTGVDVNKTFFAIFNVFGDAKAVKLLGTS